VLAACGDGAPGVVCMPAAEKGERGGEPRAIAQVDRCPVSMSSYRFGYSMLSGGGADARRYAVVTALIARELLAQGAQEAGDRPLGRGEVEKRIAKGELFAMGHRVPAEAVYREGTFEHDAFVQIADRAGVSVNALVAEQGREMLAQKMRERLGEPQVNAWLTERCKRAQAAGRLSILPEVLERFDDDGKPLPDTYVPCEAWGALL
jgi:hypothetical protein